MPGPSQKHRVVVPLPDEFFRLFLTQGAEIKQRCVSGLPEGARFIGLQYAVEIDAWLLVFEHKSFAPTPEGCMLARLYPAYEKFAEEG